MLEKSGNTGHGLVARVAGRWVGTLLGPEGMTSLDGRGRLRLCGRGAASVRVVVENCTVDASIFCFCAHLCRDFLMCVLVKLLRAHGGCLGIRSR